jgi:hypothetical protein
MVVDDLKIEVHEFLLFLADHLLAVYHLHLLQVLVAHLFRIYIEWFQLVVLFLVGQTPIVGLLLLLSFDWQRVSLFYKFLLPLFSLPYKLL